MMRVSSIRLPNLAYKVSQLPVKTVESLSLGNSLSPDNRHQEHVKQSQTYMTCLYTNYMLLLETHVDTFVFSFLLFHCALIF